MTKKEMDDDEWQTDAQMNDAFPTAGIAYPDADQAKMDEILEQPLLVKDFVTRQSVNGEFAIMLVRAKKAESDWSVPCGGKIVMEWLQYVKEHEYLPLVAVFVKERSKSHRGYSYYIPMSTKMYKEWKKNKE